MRFLDSAIGMLAVLAFGLFGCSKGNPPPAAPAPASIESATPSDAATPPAASEAPPAPPTSSTASAEPSAAPLPGTAKVAESLRPALAVGEVRFVPARTSKRSAMQLDADGTVREGEKVIGKLAEDGLLSADGTRIATLADDGTIVTVQSGAVYKLTENDAIEGLDGVRYAVEANGEALGSASGKGSPQPPTGRFEQLGPNLRRAATLMLLLQDLKGVARSQSTAHRPTPVAAEGKPVAKDQGKKNKKGTAKMSGKKGKKKGKG